MIQLLSPLEIPVTVHSHYCNWSRDKGFFNIKSEEKLWDTKVLYMDTTEGLLKAVIFYNDKNLFAG